MTASTRPSSSNRGLYLTLGAVLIVVLAAFGVAVLLGGDDGGDADTLETAPVGVEGSALPEFSGESAITGPATDPAAGEVAPTLTGVSFDGTPVSIGPDGTPKLVLFVAHWCPHCQAEIPKVQDLIDEGRVPEDVQVVAVSTSVIPERGNHPPSEWLEDEGWTPPVLLDDQASTAAQAYGLTSFPYGVYLDGENRVVARTAGEIGSEDIESLLQQLSET